MGFIIHTRRTIWLWLYSRWQIVYSLCQFFMKFPPFSCSPVPGFHQPGDSVRRLHISSIMMVIKRIWKFIGISSQYGPGYTLLIYQKSPRPLILRYIIKTHIYVYQFLVMVPQYLHTSSRKRIWGKWTKCHHTESKSKQKKMVDSLFLVYI